MRFCFISDTHMNHRRLKIEPCDILCHTGDFSMAGYMTEATQYLRWLAEQPARYKVFISGNHDFCCQVKTDGFLQLVDEINIEAQETGNSRRGNLIYLQDKQVDIEGIKIYGSPWQPWFHDWAWNFPRHHASYKLAAQKTWGAIPDNTQVLLTHGPPHKIMDLVPRALPGEDPEVGCKYLLERVLQVQPQVHAFGHIHEGYGVEHRGPTTFINASTLDGTYKNINQPFYMEIN